MPPFRDLPETSSALMLLDSGACLNPLPGTATMPSHLAARGPWGCALLHVAFLEMWACGFASVRLRTQISHISRRQSGVEAWLLLSCH